MLERTGFEAQVMGAGSLFRILLKRGPLTDYRSSLVAPERRGLYEEMYFGLLSCQPKFRFAFGQDPCFCSGESVIDSGHQGLNRRVGALG